MKHFFIVFFIFISIHALAQKSVYKGMPSLIWPKLYDIKFEKAKDKLGDYDKPLFSVGTKSLNGKTITLPGYMIPFQSGIKGNHFMLSSLPINACFFCGVGGPETVIEVNMKEPLTYSEKPIELRGVLKLNDTDPDKMIYQLEAAEYVGEAGL
jgi:hypothetical protein